MDFQAEVLEELKKIERGEVKVFAVDRSWDDVFNGDVWFVTDTGWQFGVFNDSDEWDYLDKAISPDGRVLDFDEIWNANGELNYYVPTDEEPWSLAVVVTTEEMKRLIREVKA
jgi:hypothetical protein